MMNNEAIINPAVLKCVSKKTDDDELDESGCYSE